MTRTLYLSRSATILAVATGAACSSCSDSTSVSADGVTSVVLRLAHDSLFFGQSVRVTAVATGDSAAVAHPRFVWSTSDTSVAVVDSLGTILGLGFGSARITAELNGKRDEFTIRVVPELADGGVVFAQGTPSWVQECALTGAGAAYCRPSPSGADTAPLFARRPGAAGITFTSVFGIFGGQCGLADTGNIYCWGSNAGRILGTGRSIPTDTGPAHVITGGRTFTTISAGGHAAICGVNRADSVLYCWGHNDSNQIGREPRSPGDSLAAPVTGELRARAVSTANFRTCALDLAGAAYCWGTLGVSATTLGIEATSEGVPTPRPVMGNHVFTSITTGDTGQCALEADGAAYCWGFIGAPRGDIAPRLVSDSLRFIHVSAAFRASACGITTAHDFFCWGDFPPLSVSSRLGDRRHSPYQVAKGTKFQAISKATYGVCGVTTDGRILCWGD